MRVTIPQDVVFRELAGEALLINLSSGTYFGLDPVGTRIWELLAEHGSTDTAVETLLKEYDVHADRLRRDVGALAQQLVNKGLLAPDDQKTSPAR